MSKIQQISEDLSLRLQQAVPNPQSGRVANLTESSLQRRLDRFYSDAGSVRWREKLGIVGWARVILGLRERLLRAGYPPSMVSPLIRSTLFQAARPELAQAMQAAEVPVEAAPPSRKPPRSQEGAMARARELEQSGKRQQALAITKGVLARDPANFDALLLQARLLGQVREEEAGIELVQKALAMRPDSADAHDLLGGLLLAVGESRRARDSFEQAVRLKPGFAMAHQNICATHIAAFEFPQALAAIDEALRLDPQNAKFHVLRGFIVQEMGRFDEVSPCLERAQALDPTLESAPWNLSLHRLLHGEFQAGWDLYEHRRKAHPWLLEKHFSGRPEWKGDQDLQGRSIVLSGEQGLGDVIQFSRYAELVKARGARVSLYVDPPLVPVLSQLPAVDEVIAYGAAPPASDYWAPLLSLPRVFQTALGSIPSAGAYLRADPAKVAEWGVKLGPRRAPRVGLVWSGNAEHYKDRFRNIALESLVARLPGGIEYYGLQKDVRATDKPALAASGIRFLGPELKDFTDTAALCQLMDVLVTVDTSVAHLSGALGRPTWVLLPLVPDWRWMLGRDDSPWYASLRLFRQDESRDWNRVLDRVVPELRKLSA